MRAFHDGITVITMQIEDVECREMERDFAERYRFGAKEEANGSTEVENSNII